MRSLVRVATYSGPVSNPVGGFRDANGALADPTTVLLTVRDGTGVVTTPAFVKDGVGLYHADLDTTGKLGMWTYNWDGTGTVQAPAENSFGVKPSQL